MTTSNDRVWFVTGTSTGFGRALAEALLERGDRLVATARDHTSVADLAEQAPDRVRAISMDVTDQAAIDAAVAKAEAEFGRIDVLINNAGYGQRGAVEEVTDEELRQQFDTNVFGLMSVTRTVLPLMRRQRGGQIVQISSVAGVRPLVGGAVYAASKHALEALSEGLAQEVAPLGITVTIVQPGPFRTDFSGRSIRWAEPIADYADLIGPARERFDGQHGHQPGDPARGAHAILAATELTDPPLRLPLGPQAFTTIREHLEHQLSMLDEHHALGADTNFEPGH